MRPLVSCVDIILSLTSLYRTSRHLLLVNVDCYCIRRTDCCRDWETSAARHMSSLNSKWKSVDPVEVEVLLTYLLIYLLTLSRFPAIASSVSFVRVPSCIIFTCLWLWWDLYVFDLNLATVYSLGLWRVLSKYQKTKLLRQCNCWSIIIISIIRLPGHSCWRI